MAAGNNSSSHSLSPKVPNFILTAQEWLVFQLLLSISAPFRSITDYLGHRIWISSLTTLPSWQTRLQPLRGTGYWSVTRCQLPLQLTVLLGTKFSWTLFAPCIIAVNSAFRRLCQLYTAARYNLHDQKMPRPSQWLEASLSWWWGR